MCHISPVLFVENFDRHVPKDLAYNWHIHVKEGNVHWKQGRSKLVLDLVLVNSVLAALTVSTGTRTSVLPRSASFSFQFALFDVIAPSIGMIYFNTWYRLQNKMDSIILYLSGHVIETHWKVCQRDVVWNSEGEQFNSYSRDHLCKLRTLFIFFFFLLLPDLKIWWNIAIFSPNTVWKFHEEKNGRFLFNSLFVKGHFTC